MTGSQWLVRVEDARPEDASRPSASPAYRSKEFTEKAPHVGSRTLADLWRKAAVNNRNLPCLGRRKGAGEYRFMTYHQINYYIGCLGGSLTRLTRDGYTGPRNLGIFGANCPAWFITFFACSRAGFASVPLYDTLGDEAIDYIIAHAKLQILIVSEQNLPKVAEVVGKRKGVVKLVIYWGRPLPDWNETIVAIRASGASVQGYDDFVEQGDSDKSLSNPPKPDDPATIMYTSGSTGTPKGVVLTHTAFISNVSAVDARFRQTGMSFGYGDSFLSYLPLAHIFDLTFEVWMMKVGAKIGYYRGTAADVIADAQALKPTMFIGVPRIFDRLCQAIRAKIKASSKLNKFMFHWGYNRKLTFMKDGIPASRASPMFDLAVFRGIHGMLGGCQKLIISGGAPLSQQEEEFLRVCMCCPFVQGYGLTETCAAAFVGVPHDYRMTGTVGPPLPSVAVRLESVPELGYDALADPPCGEVLVQSTHNLKEYYEDRKLTESAVDGEGWFHTGDIGTLESNGALRLIDRKKNIFKMSHGEYIAVEKVEGVLKRCPLINQIWIYGDGTRNQLIAVVVPNEAPMTVWAKSQDIYASFPEICTEKSAQEYVLGELRKTGEPGELNKFDYPAAVFLESEAFGVENDLLTPTFKPRRKNLVQYYSEQVDAMYKDLDKEKGN